jgi:hypothetical protein
MRLRWISIGALLFAVVLRGDVHGLEPDEIDFPDLVKIADRYALPRPPMKAPLVLANTGWTTTLGDSSTSHDPGIYRPAFLVRELPKGQARVLMGWTERVVNASAEHRPATRPYTLVPPDKKSKSYVLSCGNMSSFVTAVQLAQQGKLVEARKVWEQVNAAEFFDDENALEGVGRWRAKPRVLLARCLYQHFYHAVLREDADLQTIHEKLVQLKHEFPVLFSDDETNYYPHRRTRFVRHLGLTHSAKNAPRGSVEALLILWGNRTSGFRHLGFFDDHNVESDRPARSIFGMGVRAIPELAKLVEDNRLTRHVSPAIMKKPEERVRLGELARRLLKEMTGSQNLATAQTVANQKDEERAFFEDAAVDLNNGRISGFHDVPLWILGQKYPRSLLAICSGIPSRALPDVPLFTPAEVVAHSELTQEEKTEALAGVCERLKNTSGQRAVLQQLAIVNEERCVALLKPVLSKLPKDVNEPYWTCEAASYTHVLMQLQRDHIWEDYLRVAKRAAVGLRMEMMNPMNYSYIGEKNRGRRLAFLAAFLDDSTVRDPSVNAARYSGPCAAFTFGKIEVRDFAAMKIASMLHFQVRATEFWTADQWTRLRREVRAALREETLPTLTD